MEEKDSIEILSERSKELLDYQVSAFDSNYGKAGTFISISSLFTPLTFSFFDKFDNSLLTIIIFFIPIVLNLIGLYFLVKVLIPKKLNFGIGIQEFDNLLNKNYEDVKLFEIGANRTSFNENKIKLDDQNKYLRRGLTLIYISAISLALIYLTQTIILNQNRMADNNDNSGNQTTQDDGNSGRQIPEVRPEQTTIIEKGGDSGGENMSKK
jgi:hypothetical protein